MADVLLVVTGPNPAAAGGQVSFTDIPHIANQAGTPVVAGTLDSPRASSAPDASPVVAGLAAEWAAAADTRWAAPQAETGRPPRTTMAVRAMLLFMILSHHLDWMAGHESAA